VIDGRAVVHPSARIDSSANIGPFAVIGEDVEIGPDTRIDSHAVIEGPTRIGSSNHIYSFASIGGDPQDKKYRGEHTWLIIGDHNTIREYTTINRGTVQGGGKTVIGDDNWIMAYVHVAHDCLIGSHTIAANGSALAGHVVIDDYVGIGAFAKIYQFCRVGCHAFIGFDSGVTQDVPPYVTVSGTPAEPHGINSEGLKRCGFTPSQMRVIKESYRILYRRNLMLEEALNKISELAKENHELDPVIEVIRNSKRGIAR